MSFDQTALTLRDVLDFLQSGTAATRTKGLSNLRQILRYNRGSSRSDGLSDRTIQPILKSLFELASQELKAFVKAKTPASRTTTTNRLADIVSALRTCLETLAPVLKLRTVRAVCDHVQENLFLATGEFCEPSALDYVKCLRIVLAQQSHVEHLVALDPDDLERRDWEQLLDFCLESIKRADSESADGDVDIFGSSSRLNTNGMQFAASVRSSRSVARTPGGSQGNRHNLKQIADELTACIDSLVCATNAPIASRSGRLLRTVFDFLQSSCVTSRSVVDAFQVISRVVTYAKSEQMSLVFEWIPHLVRVVIRFWTEKSSTLKDEILMLLLTLRPYILQMLQEDNTKEKVRADVVSLCNVIYSEYVQRPDRDLRQLNTSDLSLVESDQTVNDALVRTELYRLRCGGIRAESNWILLTLLASLYDALSMSAVKASERRDSEASTMLTRPTKRLRLNGTVSEISCVPLSGNNASQIAGLQVLTFLVQQKSHPTELLRPCLSHALECCGDDNTEVSCWAHLLLASCASHQTAKDHSFEGIWTTAWQHVCSALSNASTSRTAAFAMYSILEYRLVTQSVEAELIRLFAHSMPVHGPPLLSDSVILLLKILTRSSQQTNPGLSTNLIEATLNWLTRVYTPSRFLDWTYTISSVDYNAADIAQLLATCMGQVSHLTRDTSFPTWEAGGQAWLYAQNDTDIMSYLLLQDSDSQCRRSDRLGENKTRPHIAATSGRTQIESIVLYHLHGELTRINESLQQTAQDTLRTCTTGSFHVLCKTACATLCSTTCTTYQDQALCSKLRKEAMTLLDSLCTILAAPDGDNFRTDSLLSVFSATFSGLDPCHERPTERWECEKLICRAITRACANTHHANNATVSSDQMDIDDIDESQGSRTGQTLQSASRIKSSFDARFNRDCLAPNACLYAAGVTIANPDNDIAGEDVVVSSALVDHLMALPDQSIISSERILGAFLSMGIMLSSEDTYTLLEHLMSGIICRYQFGKSELAIGIVLTCLSSNVATWTDPKHTDLHGLSLEIYEWFTNALVRNRFFSPHTVSQMASLLLDICLADSEYPNEASMSSARTSLFGLVQKSSITVQYRLAGRIPSLFGRFILANHHRMFNDLLASLPTDSEWIEGIAMRLLFLSRIAASWHSLLRECVYYIFETAGRVDESTAYASRCIHDLASHLPLKRPQKLFEAFSAQLLHTWLEHHSLDEIPFSAFGFSSLKQLLEANESEACAQLVLRGQKQGLEAMAGTLDMTAKSMVERSFAKCLAYAMSRDTSAPPSTPSAGVEQSTFRAILSTEVYQTRLGDQFASVLGFFFLTTQLDDVRHSWLEKRSAYRASWQALEEMRAYGHSDRVLPTGQQPSFRGRYLCDQMERLWKRIGQNAHDLPWEPWSFTLAARMLIDSMNDSLGSLQACLVVRRLRLLICFGGPVALTGYPLEMLIHSLRPLVKDSECADDTIGILQYLLDHGRKYLITNMPFVRGTVCLLIINMQKHSSKQLEQTTQESQHRATVQRMVAFQDWLVTYLREFDLRANGEVIVADFLKDIRLPGNARQDSAESNLLLFLLDQWDAPIPRCSREDLMECVKIMSDDFHIPHSAHDDCLGNDEVSKHYAQSLFELLQRGQYDKPFLAWAGMVLGRSYAGSGQLCGGTSGFLKDNMIGDRTSSRKARGDSGTMIVDRLVQLLFSRHRLVTGLAEYSLRQISELYSIAEDTEGSLLFEQMLPLTLGAVISPGTQGYTPPLARQFSAHSIEIEELAESIKSGPDASLKQWATNFVSKLCGWSKSVPIVASLASLIPNVEELATELLPQVLHILLSRETDDAASLRKVLSDAMRETFTDRDPNLCPKQQLMLKILLYLRGQAYPGETTRDDRQRWLDVDYLVAAESAAHCGMPQHALLLAESASYKDQSSRRSSGRTSFPMMLPVEIPDKLVASILTQLDEPDSFYGLNQAASLDAVLERLDYERDGFRSLMLRSAQLDAKMHQSHGQATIDSSGLIHSLSMLNMSSLIFALQSNSSDAVSHGTSERMRAAQALQQWTVSPGTSETDSTSTIFSVFQALNRAVDASSFQTTLHASIAEHMKTVSGSQQSMTKSHSWCGALTSLVEIYEVLSISHGDDLLAVGRVLRARETWMPMARYEHTHSMIANRKTLLGIVSHNETLRTSMNISKKEVWKFDMECLLSSSKLNRQHDQLQEALSDSATLSYLSDDCKKYGLNAAGAAKLETASVLANAREISSSVRMLRDVLDMTDLEGQDIPVGRAGLYARLSHQLANARLEKPEDIFSKYLKPAIDELKGRKTGTEAGEVFFQFASFCDGELQHPVNIENFNRAVKLRQAKEREVADLNADMKAAKRDGLDRTDINRSLYKAQSWLEIDTKEERRLKKSRDLYIQQSLQNYMLALAASDAHDLCVLRWFAIWLENAEEAFANAVVHKYLKDVRSYKFVRLMNQLMSRLDDGDTKFQGPLKALLYRILSAHFYHSLHHLYCSQRQSDSSDQQAQSRSKAAKQLVAMLKVREGVGEIVTRFMKADDLYDDLAQNAPDLAKGANRVAVKDWHFSAQVARNIPSLRIPPATITLPLDPGGRYHDAPVVVKWDSVVQIFPGNSHPKVLTAVASDGQRYRQLFKSGSDDLRQDAIMEQVFQEVSNMLRKHKDTRQRDLKVRTYNVIPLSNSSGIIEFVRNSIPINEWLRPAHQKYYPQDFRDTKARDIINNAKDQNLEIRVREFRKVCEHMHPVLRYFFFERFNSPDEWFARRTAYTRTTASVSMLGHVLGLGDRHCSNIMLDERTGEVVHIDLGIAFEAGRVLPIPELVPFRLTRDVVDGMGVTRTEGVFRRCCEFTMDALRDDRDSIMTLLNVLRYDPLYAWTMSPVRAKRMQNAQDTGREAGGAPGEEGGVGKKKVEDAGEADRALSIVEKKLSKTLSTAATVNELIQQATDERNLATLFHGWAAFY